MSDILLPLKFKLLFNFIGFNPKLKLYLEGACGIGLKFILIFIVFPCCNKKTFNNNYSKHVQNFFAISHFFEQDYKEEEFSGLFCKIPKEFKLSMTRKLKILGSRSSYLARASGS